MSNAVGVHRCWLAVIAGISCWLPAVVTAQTAGEQQSLLLEAAIAPLVKQHEGKVAVMVRRFENGAAYAVAADEPLPTASLIKFPVMLATYQRAEEGKLDLAKPVRYLEDDRVPGSGVLGPHFTPGVTMPLRDAVRLMIAYSDNIATNLVLKELGLPTTNALMETWGCPNTRIHAFVFRGDTSLAPERSKQFGLGSTTAREMVALLERLHRGELVSREASQSMLAHLVACDDKPRLASLLPDGTKVALKTGSVNAARTVAGIVYGPSGPFGICVLTSNNKDQRWSAENAAQVLSAEIARAAYRVFNPDQPATLARPMEPLTVGARGELIEDLQRTLNARGKPSPELTVDGEFGPATQNALRDFQRASGLEATGVTDAQTWAALGVISAKPDDAVSSAEPPPRQPADDLDGPPFVTAKAWCIGDPETGVATYGDHADERRDIASTTKVMTAYVVLTMAARDPSVLKEMVTFSAEADATIGSTAAIRTGELLAVSDLLYGLMLPSGNDAAAAFAEHFGGQRAPLADEPNAPPSARFMALMNQTAQELGMQHTQYANPHGLTHPSHKSTAHDQFTLARAALLLPTFRQIINTRQYQCDVISPTGYRRTVVWKNTNKLLDIEGYAGVKTGTTDAAGACLISLNQRQGREALLVVLGSTSTDARYTDSRNLFRYYWRERAR